MDTRLLCHDELSELVGTLIQRTKVVAPTLRDGVYVFGELRSAGDLEFPSNGLPRVSVKEFLLPRSEVLFYYKTGKNSEEAVAPPPPAEQVLFGVHPCDVQAINVLDAVFGAEPFPDELYLARRQATTIVGRGTPARSASHQGFFQRLGISSMDNRDCDLFFAQLNDEKIVLEVLTERGAALDELISGFAVADAESLAALAALRDEAAGEVTNEIDVEALHAQLKGMFDADVWQQIAEKCVGCGACAFLCPTCHCFDIQDEKHGDLGCRVRNWDTCQFELFTKHASGHNPRDTQIGRARQRIMHKFEYGYSNFGIPFCTGCGRCLQVCPVNNNLLQILEEIQKDA